LEQDVKNLRVGFFDFIEQYHREGSAANRLVQMPSIGREYTGNSSTGSPYIKKARRGNLPRRCGKVSVIRNDA
jgi:hypothetical protein